MVVIEGEGLFFFTDVIRQGSGIYMYIASLAEYKVEFGLNLLCTTMVVIDGERVFCHR